MMSIDVTSLHPYLAHEQASVVFVGTSHAAAWLVDQEAPEKLVPEIYAKSLDRKGDGPEAS